MNLNKRGLIGGVLILIILIIIVLIALASYFYFFHVFYETKVCITDKIMDLNLSCSSDDQCIDSIEAGVGQISKIGKTPEFIRKNVEVILESTVYCNEECKINESYGELFGEGKVESCEDNEKEVLVQVRGSEGLELINYFRGTKK